MTNKLRIGFATGITRMVILVGPYAIKMPGVRHGWHKFLFGLLSNMNERTFSGFAVCGPFTVAPTIWAIPGGWLNVQRRALPLTRSQWQRVLGDEEQYGATIDLKRCNFGTINGTIILIDFGEFT